MQKSRENKRRLPSLLTGSRIANKSGLIFLRAFGDYTMGQKPAGVTVALDIHLMTFLAWTFGIVFPFLHLLACRSMYFTIYPFDGNRCFYTGIHQLCSPRSLSLVVAQNRNAGVRCATSELVVSGHESLCTTSSRLFVIAPFSPQLLSCSLTGAVHPWRVGDISYRQLPYMADMRVCKPATSQDHPINCRCPQLVQILAHVK
jgi:hypothetical protein